MINTTKYTETGKYKEAALYIAAIDMIRRHKKTNTRKCKENRLNVKDRDGLIGIDNKILEHPAERECLLRPAEQAFVSKFMIS